MITELIKLPAEAIKEFKELYKSDFNVELSDQEATHKANLLYQILGATYKPIDKIKH